MEPRAIPDHAVALNYLGFAGFRLTSIPRQRSYAYELSDDVGNFLYLDHDKKLKIVVDPRICPPGTKLAGLVGKATKSTAYRRFAPLSSETEEGTGFDVSLSEIEDVVTAYRGLL